MGNCYKTMYKKTRYKLYNRLFIQSYKKKKYSSATYKTKTHKYKSKLTFNTCDPFDRLLIATAISENLNFITSDKDNQLYDVEWIWEK